MLRRYFIVKISGFSPSRSFVVSSTRLPTLAAVFSTAELVTNISDGGACSAGTETPTMAISPKKKKKIYRPFDV